MAKECMTAIQYYRTHPEDVAHSVSGYGRPVQQMDDGPEHANGSTPSGECLSSSGEHAPTSATATAQQVPSNPAAYATAL